MNIMIKNDKDNPSNMMIKLKTGNKFIIHGLEDTGNIEYENVTILDGLNNDKEIVLKNIIVNCVLNITLTQAKLYLTNIKAEKINIVSCGESFIELDKESDVKEICIWNRGNIKLKSKSPNLSLEDIYIMPLKKNFENSWIGLYGSVENCKVTILSSTALFADKSFINRLIEVNMKQDNGQLRLVGDFSNTEFNISNCKYIIGDETIPPKNVLINLNMNCGDVFLRGNLMYADIQVTNIIYLNVECLYLNKLYIGEKNKVSVKFTQNTIINSFETEGYVIIDGELEDVKNAVKQVIIVNNNGRVELNYNNKQLMGFKAIMQAINSVLLYFLKEIDFNITRSKLRGIYDNDKINIYISDLRKRVFTSQIFRLYLRRQKIIYTGMEPDASNIYMHEGIMTIVFSEGKNDMYKYVPIKGKYLYMDIDYKKKCCYIQNFYSVLNYAFAQDFLSEIVLLENMNIPNFSIYIAHKHLNIDLNGKTFLLDNINILESYVKIKNGTIKPTNKIINWNSIEEDSSSRAFIKIKGKNVYAELWCENLIVKNVDMDFYNLPKGSTNTILFYVGDCLEHSKVKRIYLGGCSLELKKQSSGDRDNGEPYVIYTFADNNVIYNNDFNESYKCIKVNGCNKTDYVNLIMLLNKFLNVTEVNNQVLTSVPYSEGGGVNLNDIYFKPDLEEQVLQNNINYLLTLSYMSSNVFGQGSSMSFWQNEKGKLIKTLKYINGKWEDFIIPIVLPDQRDNDMAHIISLGFTTNTLWSDNITEIKVVNTQEKILKYSDYNIDGKLSRIYIYNVLLNNEKLPIYQGLLEPGSNEITIKSKYYDDVKVNQFIRPIQIVKVENGIGSGIARIEKVGNVDVKVCLISNVGQLDVGEPIEISVITTT